MVGIKLVRQEIYSKLLE